MKLFVYGSLRAKMHNHYLIAGSKLIGVGVINAKMYSFGGFPAITHERGVVWGEIYEVDQGTINLCDRLEGYEGPGKNNWYERELSPVIINEDGAIIEAYVYYFAKPIEGYQVVESGNWVGYKNPHYEEVYGT